MWGTESLDEQIFLHLSGRGAWQGARLDKEFLRRLETGEVLPAKIFEFFGRDASAALPDHQACDALTPEIVGQSEHRAVSDAGVFQENLLDLRGMDVLAAGHDHVLLAAADGQIAFLVEASEVAGMDPAVAERFGRLFWIGEIRRDGVWRTAENFSEFAG